MVIEETTYWCDFCGEDFDTYYDVDIHEMACEEDPAVIAEEVRKKQIEGEYIKEVPDTLKASKEMLAGNERLIA